MPDARESPADPMLERLGIRRARDLLLHLPLRYEDETRVVPIGRVRHGDVVQVEGEVVRAEVSVRGRRTLQVDLRDATGWSGANHLARALLQAARPAAPSDQAAQGIY